MGPYDDPRGVGVFSSEVSPDNQRGHLDRELKREDVCKLGPEACRGTSPIRNQHSLEPTAGLSVGPCGDPGESDKHRLFRILLKN